MSDIIIGGPGGSHSCSKSQFASAGDIVIAPGVQSASGTFSSFAIDSCKFFAVGEIELSGATPFTVTGSQFVSESPDTGIEFAPGSFGHPGGDVTLSNSSFQAPLGNIQFWGDRGFDMDKITVLAGKDALKGEVAMDEGDAGVDFGPNQSATVTVQNSKISSLAGALHFFGPAPQILGSTLIVDGAGNDMAVGPGGAEIVLQDTKAMVKGGDMRFTSGAACRLEGSKLSVFGQEVEGEEPVGGAMLFSCGGHTVTDSSMKAALGGLSFVTASTTNLSGSKISTKPADGVSIQQAGTLTVDQTKLSAPIGDLLMLVGDAVEVSASKIVSGNTEMRIGTTSGNSELGTSKVKAASLVVESDQNTIVADNKLKIAGAVEFSGTLSCSSTNNKPDIPCL